MVSLTRQGRMFILLNLERGRVGEAISVVLTFEANDWKRFSGRYLGHQKCSFKRTRRKMKMFNSLFRFLQNPSPLL